MKKFKLSIVYLLSFVVFLFVGFQLVDADEVSYMDSKNDTYNQKFRASDIFKKYKSDLTSDIPLENSDILDSNGKIIGQNIKYEIYKRNYSETGLSEKVTSLLIYSHDNATDTEEFYLLDYSKISTDNVVELINLKDNTVQQSFEVNGKIESMAEEINNKKNTLKNEALSGNTARAGYSCKWWVCTKTESGGGSWHDPCMIFAGMLCTFAKPTAASLICQGANAIGCYVPKYKVCVNGYWATKNCPIQS